MQQETTTSTTKKIRKNAAGSKKKNSNAQMKNNQSTNNNHQVNELICNQFNNAGIIFSEPQSMDTLNSNSICDLNSKIDNDKNTSVNDHKQSIGQPVIISSILKSALIGNRTYLTTQPIKQDENIILADTTVIDDNVINNQNIEQQQQADNARIKIKKEEISEFIRQLIQVDDYTNCGRFLRSKTNQALNEMKKPNENRKLIQYVQKDCTTESNLEEENNKDVSKATNKGPVNTRIIEDLNELIQDNENTELNNSNNNNNNSNNELNDEDDEDKDELFSIIVDKKLSLNEKLCSIGDSIVFRLVQWTKRLPFYSKLPVYSITMVI